MGRISRCFGWLLLVRAQLTACSPGPAGRGLTSVRLKHTWIHPDRFAAFYAAGLKRVSGVIPTPSEAECGSLDLIFEE